MPTAITRLLPAKKPAAARAARSHAKLVALAQAIVASDWGTSSVAKKATNYFDTRCSASMTAKQFAALAAQRH